MFGFLRFLVFGFVLLTVLYIIISLWSRLVRYRKLSRQWKEEGGTGDKDAYMKEGMEDYDQSFRRKLILGVYIVPVVVIATVIYVTNFM